MTRLWPLIYLTALLFHCVHSDVIESSGSKSEDSDHNSRPHSPYDSNVYPSQSVHSTNGLNGPQQSLSLASSESSSGSYYSPGHQTNDQIDQNKNDKKTLILAIPVKLSLPKSGQDNYDQSTSRVSDSFQSQANQNFYVQSPYAAPSGQSSHQYNAGQSAGLDAEESDQSDQSVPKSATLLPLSHKIYSSPESQLKSSSYSTANNLKSVGEQSVPSSLSYSTDHKYKSGGLYSYDLKDQKSIGSQYGRDANTYRGNDYRSGNTDGLTDVYDLKYKTIGQLPYKYSDESVDTRLKQKEIGKQVYDSMGDNKSEYDYESEEDEEEEDNKKQEDEYTITHYKGYQNNNNKNGYNAKNLRKNVNNDNHQSNGNYGANPSLIANLFGNGKGITGQTMPLYSEAVDGWSQFYYPKPNPNLSGLPRFPETIDTNLMSLLNGYKNPIKPDNIRNGLYAPAFDLMADPSQLKPSGSPNPANTMENSKIYGPAAKYQSMISSYPMINLMAGFGSFGREYGLVDVNGELFPTPLVAPQPPPRKQLKPVQQNEAKGDHNSANRDSIKPHRRNPLLLRPSFMSGLRSSATKPLVTGGGGPFGSASTNSLLSVLPSLPSLPSLSGFNFNAKSIPRQIFSIPYFHG